jgi:hypothetical protein
MEPPLTLVSPPLSLGSTLRNDFAYTDHIIVSAVRPREYSIRHPSGVNRPGGIPKVMQARRKTSPPADEEIE